MDSEDFKSFCRALITFGVGSIPTRSRQRPEDKFGRVPVAVGAATMGAEVMGAASMGVAVMGVAVMGAALFLVATAWSAPVMKSGAGVIDSSGMAWVGGDTLSLAPMVGDSLTPMVGDSLTSIVGDTLTLAPMVDERPEFGPSGPVDTRPSVAWTTIKSGLVPGWGQLTNKKPLKAGLFFGSYVFFAAQAIVAEQDRKDAQSTFDESGLPADMEAVNAAVDRRNSRLWWMGGVALFSMLDAYVDVHFWKFEDQWSARVGPTLDGGAALALRVQFD